MNNDLIRRDDLKKELHSWAICLNRPSCYSKDDADYIIDYMPAVDAVEVVRCKDCRMAAMLRKPKGEVIADCMLRKFHTDDEDFIEVRGDDFCSYGERREDDG